MLKAKAAVESSWGTSRIWDKATWHQDNDENRECCNMKGQSTSNYELSWFRKMRDNTWYMEGGIQGTKRKERRKVPQAWESSAFQENQRENVPLHWLLYLSTPLPSLFPFYLVLLHATLHQILWNTRLHAGQEQQMSGFRETRGTSSFSFGGSFLFTKGGISNAVSDHEGQMERNTVMVSLRAF